MKIFCRVMDAMIKIFGLLCSLVLLGLASHFDIDFDIRPTCIFIIVFLLLNWTLEGIENIVKKYFGKEYTGNE